MCCAGWKQQGDECGIGEWDILGTWAVGVGVAGIVWGLGAGQLRSPLVRSRVRRQLHVFGERGVRAAWRVPLPPWLLRCQLRHQ